MHHWIISVILESYVCVWKVCRKWAEITSPCLPHHTLNHFSPRDSRWSISLHNLQVNQHHRLVSFSHHTCLLHQHLFFRLPSPSSSTSSSSSLPLSPATHRQKLRRKEAKQTDVWWPPWKSPRSPSCLRNRLRCGWKNKLKEEGCQFKEGSSGRVVVDGERDQRRGSSPRAAFQKDGTKSWT